MDVLLRPISALGAAATAALTFVGGLGHLLADTAVAARAGLFSRTGVRFGWQNLWLQMDRVGVQSVPIVMLVLACIGAIMSLQIAPILRSYGQESQVATVNEVSVLRELGPLLGAVVLTGFAGASIAAELGTMVVGEEIEALTAVAIDPIRYLVVPRVIGTTVMMVCLAVMGDLAGLGGGLLTSKLFLGINAHQYVEHTFAQAKLQDFLTGLVKAGVFGLVISSLACYMGLRVTGGALGVGRATTYTVVYTIVGLIVVDLLFTSGFYFLGL
jgi:phospholipid/cholesterol/gamma-HCH transport system permease protein